MKTWTQCEIDRLTEENARLRDRADKLEIERDNYYKAYQLYMGRALKADDEVESLRVENKNLLEWGNNQDKAYSALCAENEALRSKVERLQTIRYDVSGPSGLTNEFVENLQSKLSRYEQAVIVEGTVEADAVGDNYLVLHNTLADRP